MKILGLVIIIKFKDIDYSHEANVVLLSLADALALLLLRFRRNLKLVVQVHNLKLL